jgi:hypothetical protein
MRSLVLLAGVIFFFAGCATDPGAKIAKYNIKTVGVEPRVNAGALRYSEIVPGAPNADLTGLIMDVIRSKQMKRMAAVMQEHKIDVPAIVRSNFVQAVNEIGYEYSEAQPDATFVLELSQYGFDQRSLFSSAKVPFAVLDGRLVTADGKTIWRGNSQEGKDVMLGRSANSFEKSRAEIGVPEWEDYERDPEKLRQDWERAIRAAVIDLLSAAKKAKQS